MSYLVLARKYRPRSFEQMVGQEHVVQALSNALTQQRLHHAYLFTGTRGVGKTTVSRILAKSLNCQGADGQGGITAQPCGVCQACRDIDAGRFVDYVELDAASNRGVEEISQLLDQAVYKPVVGRFKVYMIDEVHMLSTTAFNAMLKTLEEPPEYLKFVLATTDPQKVPVTVLSRCLQFNLRPMAPATVLEHLQGVLQAEGIEADAGSLRLLARAARGSMRDALSLTDQAIAYGSGTLSEPAVRQMLGAADRGHVFRLVDALAAADGAALLGTVDEMRAHGLSAHGVLEDMASLLQQMAVAQVVPQAVDQDDPHLPVIERLAAAVAPDETQLYYSMALHGRNEIGLAPDEYSGLTMVLLRMLAFKPAQGGTVRSTTASLQRSPVAVARSTARVAGTPAIAAPPAASAATRSSTDADEGAGDGADATAATARARAPATQPVQAPANVRVSAPAVSAPSAPAASAPSAPASPSASAPAAPRPMASVPPWEEDIPPEDLDVIAAPAVSRSVPAPAHSPSFTESGAGATPARPRASDAMATAAPVVSWPATAAVGSPVQTTPLGDRWVGVVRQLVERELVAALVRELALQSQCVAADEGSTPERWQLRVERETLASEASRAKLEAAMAEALGRPVALAVEVGATQDTPARRDAAERVRRQQEAEDLILNDPAVVSLMQQFPGARIVPGSVKPL